MRTLNAVGFGLGASILAAPHLWPIGVVLVLAEPVRLVHGLLAERARRRTLESLCERAPASTLIIQHQGPGGPAMTVRIGAPEGSGPPMPPDDPAANPRQAARERR